jgi:hypothetical protein
MLTSHSQSRKVMGSAAAAAILMLILELIASKLTLYYVWPWFDIFMHTLGGMTVALALIAAVEGYTNWMPRSLSAKAMFVSGGVILVGLLWELFEYLLDRWLGVNLQPSIPDTIADLLFDTVGALVVVVVISLFTIFRHE